MTRFAKHKKEKKPSGEDATPWEEMKESSSTNEKEKRREEKRLEKKRKRELKKVCCLFFILSFNNFSFDLLDLFSLSNCWTFHE